jgi:hypothetical protein
MTYQQPPRGPRSRRIAMAIVAAAVLSGIVAGGGIGALAGTMTSRPEGPSRPPALPADFPGGGGRYLPGVTVASVQDLLSPQGYECTTDDPEFQPQNGASHRLDCFEPSDASASVQVVMEYDDPAQVRITTAHCRRGPRSPEDFCRVFYSELVGAAFAGQPDLREEARTWAGENAENDTVTVLGGIELRAALQDHSMTLLPAA